MLRNLLPFKWLGTESNRRHADFQSDGTARSDNDLAPVRSAGASRDVQSCAVPRMVAATNPATSGYGTPSPDDPDPRRFSSGVRLQLAAWRLVG